MDRDTPHQISTEEAKARLRAAAQELSLGRWIGRRSWRVLAVSVAGGFIVGRLRLPAMTGALLMQRMAPLLLTVLLSRRR